MEDASPSKSSPEPNLPERTVGGVRLHGRALALCIGYCAVCYGWIRLVALLDGSGRLPDWFGAGSPAIFPVAGCALLGAVAIYWIAYASRRREQRLQTDLQSVETMLLTSQKMEAFGVLSAGIAHDFSNTLTVIRGMTDLARLESYDPRVSRSAMEAIQMAAFRGEEIARQLVDFLAKPRDQFALRDLNVVTRDFSPILRQAAGPRAILAYELDEALPATLLSRTLIEQALLNLVINARDAVALSDPQRITIATKTVELIDQRLLMSPRLVSGSFIELSVTDNGCGIPEHDILHAFQPFFTTKEKGTGLGLPSVLRVIQHHEGHIDVRSKHGGGTCVRLFLPVRSSVKVTTFGVPAPSPAKVG